ncbi:GIY-YIG nuclease family protein [Alginatibacterium sediminis]|uniref:GIY-YIG nuclease family protein n=1 Tax=Alginatibacterium sediminis TaxID=2164068 RepID=A0A420EDH9_9ALTE|nr:GIY-YIG nuclease family protein [Alginatibacterium sediminis]RKF18757.1 GIY-YIG nuclease family protein [Alginatibacterium sediminis]
MANNNFEVIYRVRNTSKTSKYASLPGANLAAAKFLLKHEHDSSAQVSITGPGHSYQQYSSIDSLELSDKQSASLYKTKFPAKAEAVVNRLEYRGVLEFVLSYQDLLQIQHSMDFSWRDALSQIKAVYLILDLSDGNQYVGAAIGSGGLWQRWLSYTSNGHGGNKLLVERLVRNPDAFINYQFTVLQAFEINTPDTHVLEAESLVKRKLGSRSFGLNSN